MPRPYHHGNLREALVESGKTQIALVGLADLSLRRIAAEVGVSQVAPKHHFGNKEGLLAAIAAAGFRDLAAFRSARLKNAATSEERLRTMLSSYVAFALQHQALFLLMFSAQFKAPSQHAELAMASGEAYGRLREAAAAFLADLKGKGSVDGLTADEAARVAWMSLHGVAMLLMDGQVAPQGAARISRERLVSRTLDIVFAGIRRLGAR